MAQISDRLRARLKKPLGELVPFAEAAKRCRGRRVIAVGDEIVFNFLELGKIPFVSVFDLKTLRKSVAPKIKGKILEFYPNPQRTEKPAGELSVEMFGIAKLFLEKGGALYVEGEEDLFALPFALLVHEEIVIYGQPGQGCVILEKGNFEKKELEKELKEMGLVLSH